MTVAPSSRHGSPHPLFLLGTGRLAAGAAGSPFPSIRGAHRRESSAEPDVVGCRSRGGEQVNTIGAAGRGSHSSGRAFILKA